MIHVYRRRLGDSWYAAAVSSESGGIFATSFALTEREVLKSVLASLPYNASFEVVDEPSQAAEKVLAALHGSVSGEGASPAGFSFEMAHLPEYTRRVLGLLARVPVGYVTTYGALARAAGGRGARAVGNVMAGNRFAPLLPCHRVVRSDYSLGGYGGDVLGPGVKTKWTILQRENKGYKDAKTMRVGGDAVLSLYPVSFVRKS